MKILFTGHNKLIDPIIYYLSNRHDVFVFHNSRKSQLSIGPANIINVQYRPRISWGQLNSPNYVADFSNIVKSIDPQIIFIMDFHKLLFWQVIRYKKNNLNCKIYLYTEMKKWSKNIISKLGVYLFWIYLKKNIDFVENILTYTKQGLYFWKNRFTSKKINILVPPIDIEKFYPDADKTFMIDYKLKILMVARFVKYKRHNELIKALDLIRNDIDFELTLVGGPNLYMKQIKNKIDDLKLTDRVKIVESVNFENMREIYLKNDLLILPSYNEAIGMVVPEAMACGIPTITSDTVGANTYVTDGVTGLVFKTGDYKDLSNKILEVSNKETLEKFGKNAASVISEKFSFKNIPGNLNFLK